MKLSVAALIALFCAVMTVHAGDWAYQGGDPGYTKYASDNIPADGVFSQLYSKRFYSKFSADINPNYNFSTGVLIRNGQAWIISSDQPDTGGYYAPVIATKFTWTTGTVLTHSNLPSYGSPGSPDTFHPNECSGELDTNHCNFPALWAPDGRIYVRRGGDQRCLGAMDANLGTWTMLPKDGSSDQANGYDTPAFLNYYNNNLIYHGGYAGGSYGYAVADVSAAAWANGAPGQFKYNLPNASPTYGTLGPWTINCRREGDQPKAAANMAVLASYSTNLNSISTMYVTATNLVTGQQAWTKNYATNACGQTGTRAGGFYWSSSDYWRFIATEDGKYIYYVRNGGLTILHVDNIATGEQIITPLVLNSNSDPVMAYNNNCIYVAGAHEQMKIDATTGAVIWRQTNSFTSDQGYALSQNWTGHPTYSPSIDPLYRPAVLTNDTMWWVDGSTIGSGHLVGMSTATGAIVQNIDLAAMVQGKNPNERLIAVNDLEDANGQLGVLVDIGDITDSNYTSGDTNKVKYQDLYVFGSRLIGDATCDGAVNYQDYIALELGFGMTHAAWTDGDFNNDGLVNYKDYLLLENHFGTHVPEPLTMSLLALGGAVLLRRRR